MISARDIARASVIHHYTRPTTERIRSVLLACAGALILAWLAAEKF